MKSDDQFDSIETALEGSTEARIHRLIEKLRHDLSALGADILTEEDRCGTRDQNDVAYPWEAKSWTERCRNLELTIAKLESRVGHSTGHHDTDPPQPVFYAKRSAPPV